MHPAMGCRARAGDPACRGWTRRDAVDFQKGCYIGQEVRFTHSKRGPCESRVACVRRRRRGRRFVVGEEFFIPGDSLRAAAAITRFTLHCRAASASATSGAGTAEGAMLESTTANPESNSASPNASRHPDPPSRRALAFRVRPSQAPRAASDRGGCSHEAIRAARSRRRSDAHQDRKEKTAAARGHRPLRRCRSANGREFEGALPPQILQRHAVSSHLRTLPRADRRSLQPKWRLG